MTSHRNSTKMEVNVVDYFGLILFAPAIAVSLGLLDSTLAGFDMAQVVLDLGAGHTFSMANIIAIGTLGYVAYTNDWNGGLAWQGIQGWLVLSTVALIIAPPFFPILVDTLAETPAALVAFVVQIGGYMTFSYVG